MSTTVEEVKEVQAKNGAAAEPRRVPVFPFVAAPFAAVAAAIIAVRLARRAQAQPAKPSVYWSFSFASGNRLTFRPTMIRAGRPAPRPPVFKRPPLFRRPPLLKK